jgi:hypothetical protein
MSSASASSGQRAPSKTGKVSKDAKMPQSSKSVKGEKKKKEEAPHSKQSKNSIQWCKSHAELRGFSCLVGYLYLDNPEYNSDSPYPKSRFQSLNMKKILKLLRLRGVKFLETDGNETFTVGGIFNGRCFQLYDWKRNNSVNIGGSFGMNVHDLVRALENDLLVGEQEVSDDASSSSDEENAEDNSSSSSSDEENAEDDSSSSSDDDVACKSSNCKRSKSKK